MPYFRFHDREEQSQIIGGHLVTETPVPQWNMTTTWFGIEAALCARSMSKMFSGFATWISR